MRDKPESNWQWLEEAEAAHSQRPGPWWLRLLALLLGLLFFAQALYWQQQSQAELQPQTLTPSPIQIERSALRPHPDYVGIGIVDLLLSNPSDSRQALPDLLLRVRTVATTSASATSTALETRRLSASQYLGEHSSQPLRALAPGQQLHVQLHIDYSDRDSAQRLDILSLAPLKAPQSFQQ